MAEIKVFYNEDCQLCPPYLEDIQRCSKKFSHSCELLSLQKNPLDIIADLQLLRESGHAISSLPFFVVSDGEHKYSYEGIFPPKIISEILEKFKS